MQDRFRVRGWSVFDSGYYDDIQNMLFGEEDNMTLLDAISKGLVNEIIPEQCTGLKDKNGKPIYEGDIVKLQLSYDENLSVEYSEGSFNLVGNYGFRTLLRIYKNDCEVVGNIHENPELLEEE